MVVLAEALLTDRFSKPMKQWLLAALEELRIDVTAWMVLREVWPDMAPPDWRHWRPSVPPPGWEWA
jgi:hypothetical protein